MNKNTFETALGAFVLIVAVIFLILSYRMSNVSSGSGFTILADFSGIGGLKAGDSVQISGVKIGTISDVSLFDAPTNFRQKLWIGHFVFH